LGNDLDFNSDGKIDVFLMNSEWYYGYPYVHIFLNNGDRTFSFETFQFAEIIDSFCTDAVWVWDINGDGNLDFVMGTMSNRYPRTSLLLLSPHQTKHLMLRILTMMVIWI
jgi:hypothetical protein